MPPPPPPPPISKGRSNQPPPPPTSKVPTKNAEKGSDRGALLNQIQAGKRLKSSKHLMVDKSKPLLSSSSSSPAIASSPTSRPVVPKSNGYLMFLDIFFLISAFELCLKQLY